MQKDSLDLDLPDEEAEPAELAAWTQAVLQASPAVQTAWLAQLEAVLATVRTIREAEAAAALLPAGASQAGAHQDAAAAARTAQRTALDALQLLMHDQCGVPAAAAHAATALLVQAVVTAGPAIDPRTTLEFVYLTAARCVAGLPVLPLTAAHWAAVTYSAGPAPAVKVPDAVHDPRLLTAMMLWARDRATTVPFHVPFHPIRRRLIALRHQLTRAPDDAARLALFHARHAAQTVEADQAMAVRMQDIDAIREHASLQFLQASYRPRGGYTSPQQDDWAEQLNRLKEMNKYTASKKGGGKRKGKK